MVRVIWGCIAIAIEDTIGSSGPAISAWISCPLRSRFEFWSTCVASTKKILFFGDRTFKSSSSSPSKLPLDLVQKFGCYKRTTASRPMRLRITLWLNIRIPYFEFKVYGIVATKMDYEIWQMDVKKMFLNGILEEYIYMESSKGFAIPNNKVCNLKISKD